MIEILKIVATGYFWALAVLIGLRSNEFIGNRGTRASKLVAFAIVWSVVTACVQTGFYFHPMAAP